MENVKQDKIQNLEHPGHVYYLNHEADKVKIIQYSTGERFSRKLIFLEKMVKHHLHDVGYEEAFAKVVFEDD